MLSGQVETGLTQYSLCAQSEFSFRDIQHLIATQLSFFLLLKSMLLFISNYDESLVDAEAKSIINEI